MTDPLPGTPAPVKSSVFAKVSGFVKAHKYVSIDRKSVV